MRFVDGEVREDGCHDEQSKKSPAPRALFAQKSYQPHGCDLTLSSDRNQGDPANWQSRRQTGLSGCFVTIFMFRKTGNSPTPRILLFLPCTTQKMNFSAN